MSLTEYDAHYLEENYFGEPLKALMKFFNDQPNKGKLLDLGCGQGRDAIPIAEMGYEVTGVDISKVGIDQMIDLARRKNLLLRGVVADIYNFEFDKDYDFVLLDSMLHFEEEDLQKEKDFVRRLANIIKPNATLCISIWESKKNQQIISDILGSHADHWEIDIQNNIDYVFPGEGKYEFKYTFITAKKL